MGVFEDLYMSFFLKGIAFLTKRFLRRCCLLAEDAGKGGHPVRGVGLRLFGTSDIHPSFGVLLTEFLQNQYQAAAVMNRKYAKGLLRSSSLYEDQS